VDDLRKVGTGEGFLDLAEVYEEDEENDTEEEEKKETTGLAAPLLA
jgi:hypothetical protein